MGVAPRQEKSLYDECRAQLEDALGILTADSQSPCYFDPRSKRQAETWEAEVNFRHINRPFFDLEDGGMSVVVDIVEARVAIQLDFLTALSWVT